MGRIFLNQTKLTLTVSTGIDLTTASTVLIKYIKPTEATGSFTAAVLSATGGTIDYDIVADDLDEYGCWIFWAHITFSDATIAQGEPQKIHVYKEGEL